MAATQRGAGSLALSGRRVGPGHGGVARLGQESLSDIFGGAAQQEGIASVVR
jgi:hypothetical protein